MKNYIKPNAKNWSGRKSGAGLYLHETVVCRNLDKALPKSQVRHMALLGYACDAGVARNQGRTGASGGPEAIRSQLGRLPNHLNSGLLLWDTGNIYADGDDMEAAQQALGHTVKLLLETNAFPIVLGGGHDMAYGHYNGLRSQQGDGSRIGIINFDAHFDLREPANGTNSGTPFYQLAEEAEAQGRPFDYLCLGIRRDANDSQLFKTAERLGTHFIEREDFNMHELTTIQMVLLTFIERVDSVYITIDLDGFSSAYAPGVSAPSPMGFSPDIVWESLKIIIDSRKLLSLDIAELNPKFDIDHQTARLAASLIHSIIHRMALLQP